MRGIQDTPNTAQWYDLNIHFFSIFQSYSDISTNPDDYEGQTVLIVGRGEMSDSVGQGGNFLDKNLYSITLIDFIA